MHPHALGYKVGSAVDYVNIAGTMLAVPHPTRSPFACSRVYYNSYYNSYY